MFVSSQKKVLKKITIAVWLIHSIFRGPAAVHHHVSCYFTILLLICLIITSKGCPFAFKACFPEILVVDVYHAIFVQQIRN